MTTASSDGLTTSSSGRVWEVAVFYLRLGLTAFGGPAVHIAIMHDEVVKRRQWVDEQHFLDMLGATNLIPGPNSTEMTIHLGYARAGWPGLIAGGVCFILPAMLIVMGLGWVYAAYGATPAANWLLYGIKPAMMAIIAMAFWDLGRKAARGPLTIAVGLGVLALAFLNVNEILLLFGGGLVVMIGGNLRRLRRPDINAWVLPLAAPPLTALAGAAFSLPVLFLTMLKIGSVLYGSGYVLLAFLRADFVTRLGWLTDRQLLDAVAIGQVTPGPVLATATFIGYILGGPAGALLATLGIFLPAFIFVAVSNPLIPRIRSSPWISGLLDGVNVASLGLMAAVTFELGRASLVDPLTFAIALVSLILLVGLKINATWLVAGGAVIGLLSAALR
jgi:chromate transporter